MVKGNSSRFIVEVECLVVVDAQTSHDWHRVYPQDFFFIAVLGEAVCAHQFVFEDGEVVGGSEQGGMDEAAVMRTEPYV